MKKHSILHVYAYLLIFLGLTGLFLVLVNATLFYRFNIDRILLERVVNIQTLSNTIGSPFWIHQELLHIPGTVENFMQEMANIPGIVFVRIVNLETKTVKKSSDRREVGMKIENPPLFEREKVITRDGIFRDAPITELSIKSKSGDNLWMGVSLKSIQRNIFLTAVLIGWGILILFGIMALVIFFVSRRFVIDPLTKLSSAFKKLKNEDYKVRLGEISGAEMQSVFYTFNDMTIRLAEIRNRERAVSAAKSEFIRIAAHQLRTPLTPIIWGLQELKKAIKTEEEKQQIENALKRAEDMINLVNSMLNVSRIEAGGFLPEKQPTDIKKLINDVFKNFEPTAHKKNLTYTMQLPEKEMLPMQLDQVLIQVAVNNLIGNAINYTPEGGSVTISVEEKDGTLLIRVRDTGIGITPEERSKIFNKLYRSTRGIRLQPDGMGLGLYIAQQIVNAHGGELVLEESEEGKGSTFRIALSQERLE